MVLLTEIEEKIVKHYLDEFIFYGIIRTKTGNRYVFLKEPDLPIEIPSVGIKLSDALNIYIQKCLKSRKPSTSRGHRIYTDKHILPFFKDKSISDISPMDIVEFIKHIQSQGYTHRTVENIFFFLKRAILEFDDKFKFPEIHRLKDTPSLKILSEEEIKKILKAVKFNKAMYPIVLTAVATGLSVGELLAINWDDVDFEHRKLRISKNLLSKSTIWRKPPFKIRYVDMPEMLAKFLKSYQKNWRPNRYNAVFANGAGNFHNTHNIRGRDLEKIIEHARIEKTTFKILQDSYAVMMIQKNQPLTFIQNQLGHKSVQHTADRYKEFLKTAVDFDFEL